MSKKRFSSSQVIAMVLITALLSNPVSVFGTVEDNICSLSSVLAPFFGVGKETVTPSADTFPTASIVEKINYLESENTELKNQMLALSADNSTLSAKVDYLQTTTNARGGGI